MNRYSGNNPWLGILLAGGHFSIVLGSLWMGLAVGAFGILWLRKKLAEQKTSGKLVHVNHRWWIREAQKWRFAKRLDKLMPYPVRQRHGIYLGKSGSGKSMLLKARIMADLSHKAGVLLIDPHGDLVKEIARLRIWEKQSDRLVYLSPADMANGVFPSFNPFSQFGEARSQERSVRVGELAAAFEALLRDAYTHHQSLMLKRCISLLLHQRGSTILDLQKLLSPGGVQLALRQSPPRS